MDLPPSIPPASPPKPPPPAGGWRDLAGAGLVEESRPVALARMTILILTATLGVGLIWAGLSVVPVQVVAAGRVSPPPPPLVLTVPDGGVIARIEVRDGEAVSAGQALLRLDPAPVAAGLAQARAQMAALQVHADRLRARIDSRPADLTSAPSAAPMLAESAPGEAERQAAVAEATIVAEIEQSHAALREVERSRLVLQKELEAARQHLRQRQEQAARLLISRARLQEAEQDVTQLESLRGQLQAKDQAVREALAEAEAHLADLRTGQRRQAMDELAVTLDTLTRSREAVGRLEQRAQHLEVSAPAPGLVRGLAARHAGESLAPGETVAEVVPAVAGSVVALRLPLSEAERVRPGQAVLVRSGSGGAARSGRVDSIGEAGIGGDAGLPTRLVQILVPSSDSAGLVPGQAVEVAIVVGERSPLRSMLAPLLSRLGVEGGV